ncbi:fused MFS/spermidine synthase [Leeia sp. TBRC 13508]|uniref:Polyamine aminopropyltransferase n=1 Tax=Leeia speluncae TaxID=2884804 RepID=A0ABS8D252_9NEIS|nr:fused MFS/spermidine synthase [Leeia speluncae]MCB6182066.1 fused MFS/spermidine synthase [Leeia speluncae]
MSTPFPPRGAVPLLPTLRPGCFHLGIEPLPTDTPVYCEDTSDPVDIFGFRAYRVLHSEQTDFQNVLIADLVNLGRALFLDGVLQSSEYDEALYHESLVQPALLALDNPRDVLIIGGGEGATLRESLSHPCVKKVTMVDIDPKVVAACEKHLPTWHRNGFRDPRAKVVHTDGRAFVENDDSFYDLAIIDVVDMFDNGPAQRIYTKQFYQHLKKRLRPNGIVVVQGMEFSHVDFQQHSALVRTLRTVFPQVHSYQVAIPSFLSPWGYVIASDWFDPRDWTPSRWDARLAKRLGQDALQHLDGDFISRSFMLCKETRRLLAMPGLVLSDDEKYIHPTEVEDITESLPVYPARKEQKR